jgi:outer membrane receptor for ferrienterochelin and colicins
VTLRWSMFLVLNTALVMSSAFAADEDPDSESALAEIIVTTTRMPRRLADEPTRIEVIDQSELEEKIAMSPGDVAMLLNETSGLRVQTTSPGLGAANVRIQGLRGRYSQILADGLPLYGGQTGGIGLLQIPPLDLGQVEVLKGVASALYGASALGGVINFVSRRPDGAHDVLLNQTSRGGTDAALWWSGNPVTDGYSYSLLATADRQTSEDINGEGWADVPRFRRAVIRPRLYWANGAGAEMFLTAGAMLEDRSGGTVKDGRVPVGNPTGTAFIEALKTQRFDLGLSGRWPIAEDRTLTVRASATTRDLRQTFGTVIEPSRSNTAFGEAALNGTSGPHSWVVGLAFQHDRYRNDAVSGFNFTYQVPGLFAQDEYRISDALTLSVSARLDQHNRYGTFFSPRLAMLWRPGGGASPWRMRVSLGTGFFAPTPITEDTEATGLSRILPIANLRAERAQGFSVDLGRLWKLDHASIETNVTMFGSELKNAVSLVQVSDIPPQFAFANAEAPTRNVGTELLLRWRSGPIALTATHAYVNSTEFPPDALERRAVPLNPRHSGTFTATWEEEEIGRIGIEGLFTGRQSLIDNPYRSTSPSFLMFGILLQRRFGAASVSLNAENLIDRRLTRVQPLVLPERAADGRWTTDAWGPLDGRVINLSIRWRFGGSEQEEHDSHR